MTEFGSFDNSTCKRVLDLLEPRDLTLGQVVIKSIKGSMSKVAKSFICRGYLNLVTSAVRTSVDIGASAKLELVDKFCYLGDMFSVDGDADAAVEARIRIG